MAGETRPAKTWPARGQYLAECLNMTPAALAMRLDSALKRAGAARSAKASEPARSAKASEPARKRGRPTRKRAKAKA